MKTGGEIELKSDLDDGTSHGEWRLWQREMSNAHDFRKEFDKEVDEYNKIYKNEAQGQAYAKNRLPIFWSNTQTLKPLIYSNLPSADIRRRYASKDAIARLSSIMLERATNYFLETSNANEAFEQARDDSLITGMGVVKVRFEADIVVGEDGEEDVAEKMIKYDFIPYKDYLSSPAQLETLVRWRAYRHRMTKQELIDQFGAKKANSIRLNASILEDPEKGSPEENETFKRAEVWEIWDKEDKRVKFWCEGYSEGLLSNDPDDYNLTTFFPSADPINMGPVNDTILPIPLYRNYKSQATELNIVVDRISRVTEQIKAGGVYTKILNTSDASNFLNNDDGEYSPVDGVAPDVNLANQIWTKPIESLANVSSILRQQKYELIQEIRDITGISDIVRGTTFASETATAQQLKGDFAISRIQPLQKEMSIFVRDTVRITSELLAENWTGEELAEISNMKILQQEDMDIRILEEVQKRELEGNPLTPEELAKLTEFVRQEQDRTIKTELAVTDDMLDQVEQVLRNDKLRGYSIDIETDATVKVNSERVKAERMEFLNVVSGMINQYVPLVQAGVLPIEVVKAMIGFGSRPFKIGRQLEEAFELLGEQQEEEQGPPEPDILMIDAQLRSRELDIKEKENQQDFALGVAKLEQEAAENEADREAEFTLQELKQQG
jgi:hypothetical protein